MRGNGGKVKGGSFSGNLSMFGGMRVAGYCF
jgi:hypothetical protein